MKRILLWAASLLFLCGILEAGARLIAHFAHEPSAKPLYLELSQGYPKAQQLIQDREAVRLQYHDYYIYSPAPLRSSTVNFSDYFGARATPASAADAEETIWAFGGSTMQNLEADDELSLANQIAVALNQGGAKVRVRNFGSSGFQSTLELIKFQTLLREVPPGDRPSIAIFYDGFNETQYGYYWGPAAMQADISLKLRDLVERQNLRLLAYLASELIAKHGVFWSKYVRPRLGLYEEPFPLAAQRGRSVAAYVTNVRMAAAICTALQIRCRFFLQPLVVTRSPLRGVEQQVLASLEPEFVEFVRGFYRDAARELQDQQGFFDLSHALDAEPEPQFFDFGHTSPYAGVTLGREMAQRIRSTVGAMPAAPAQTQETGSEVGDAGR